RREARLLPAGGAFPREGDRGQQRAGRAPEVADVRAGVLRALVKPQAGDEAVDVRAELDSDLERVGVVRGGDSRRRRARPDGARTRGRRRAGGEGPGEITR